MGTKKSPPYLVYQHFLAWINQQGKDAKLFGAGDSYNFAESFSRATLQHQELDGLREAAHRLDADLRKHQARTRSW